MENSLRTFKSRYQKTLNRKSPDQKYVIAAFTLADFTALCKTAGHEAGQIILKNQQEVVSINLYGD